MNLSAPKQTTFLVSVVLAILGLLGTVVSLGFITSLSPWLILLGFIVLAASVMVPGL